MDNSIDRAALVLGLLGDDVAEDILALLKPEQAERLRRHRAGPSASSGNRHLRATVLEDFNRFLRFVEQQTGPSLGLYSEEDSKTDKGGRKRRGGHPTISIDPHADPAEGLEKVTEFQVAGALEQEPPRAAALLLSVLPPQRSAEILAHLPDAIREKIVPELGREQSASPPVIDRLMRTVLKRALSVPPEGIERVDRVQRLADVLRAVARPQRRKMMETLEQHDAETSAAVMEKLYVFADLKAANDRLVQKVLTEVDGTALATALATADEDIREKIFANLSRRAQASLREELEFQRNIPAAQVEAAQREIARALARADQEAE
ncbi:MAG: FliG C-terminal domain-containing protein [Planctomycetaceae bacterium]